MWLQDAIQTIITTKCASFVAAVTRRSMGNWAKYEKCVELRDWQPTLKFLIGFKWTGSSPMLKRRSVQKGERLTDKQRRRGRGNRFSKPQKSVHLSSSLKLAVPALNRARPRSRHVDTSDSPVQKRHGEWKQRTQQNGNIWMLPAIVTVDVSLWKHA